jgi:selenide,water dikinase
VLREVLRGGLDKLKEAGVMLVGGHSIRDDEPKFGMSVSGIVHPDRIWRNGGALPGDVLVLTKALGTGVLATAYKRDALDDAGYAPAVASMSALNRDAMLAAREGTVHACTDITGFGLAGHAMEMAKASNATVWLFVDALPALPGARDAIVAGHVPAGAKNNRAYLGDQLRLVDLDDVDATLVVDPQTSGGLLLAVPADEAAALLARLHARGVAAAAVVGEVVAGEASVVCERRS